MNDSTNLVPSSTREGGICMKGEDLILATSCLHSKVAIKAAASMDLGAQGRQSRGFKTKGFRFRVLGLIGD